MVPQAPGFSAPAARPRLTRRAALLSAAGLLLPGIGVARADDGDIRVGVSGPLTGDAAQYGQEWRQGFAIALAQINGRDGGIHGRKLVLDFQDSQNDPRQAVAIAQKFVADPGIVVELGDFSSTTSMAASPIYQRGKLVQLGFTNSNPKFTLGGDYMWSPGASSAEEQPQLADLTVVRLGFKRPAVLHLNTDFGTNAKNLYVVAAGQRGATVVATEGYLPDERDFRSILTRVMQAKPDSLVLESYYSDAALIVRQAREAGITLPIAGNGSMYAPEFLKLAGPAAEGFYTESEFVPNDPRPEVQSFVAAFRAVYHTDPDLFSALAYDALILTATVMRQFGTDRASFHAGLAKVRDVPSVIFGKFTFDPKTRRVFGEKVTGLVVKNGQFVVMSS
jgi:branched-chain amino acid transport system substrate-binding protein